MNHRQKPNLLTRIAGTAVLTFSVGCYELAADAIGIAGGYSNDSKVRDVSGVVSRGLSRSGERARTKRERRDDLEFEIEREKRLRELDKEEFDNQEPELNEVTKDTLNKLLGKGEDNIDCRQLVTKVEQICRKNFIDYERNIRTINRTLSLKGLTSYDKNRLLKLLEDMVNNETIAIDRGFYKRKAPKFSKERDILFEYTINRPDVKPQLKIKIMQDYPHALIRHVKTNRFSNNEAVELLTTKIKFYEEAKDKAQFSSQESKVLSKTLLVLKKYQRYYSRKINR